MHSFFNFYCRAIMFLWSIIIDLSLVSTSPYDDELSLYAIFKAISCTQFY